MPLNPQPTHIAVTLTQDIPVDEVRKALGDTESTKIADLERALALWNDLANHRYETIKALRDRNRELSLLRDTQTKEIDELRRQLAAVHDAHTVSETRAEKAEHKLRIVGEVLKAQHVVAEHHAA